MITWTIIALAAMILAIALAGVMIPQILLISFRKNLFDEQDERKIHKGVVPRLGGIAFMPVVFIVMALIVGIGEWVDPVTVVNMMPHYIAPLAFAFCGILILYVVGLADDLIGIRYRAKFVAQLLCALLILCDGVWLDNLWGLFGITEISPAISWPLTILFTIFVVNAINLIDGIDGLASGLSACALAIYGYTFLSAGEYVYGVLSFATLGVLLPFFYYNVFGNVKRQKKIFMGDTGALTIGMMLVFLSIQLLHCTPVESGDALALNMAVVAFSPLIVPCFDVVRVYMLRIRLGHNPFLPDRNHIHHYLLAVGWSQRRAMISILAFSVMLSLLNNLLSRYVDINIILVFDIVVWTLLVTVLSACRRNKAPEVAAQTKN